jgi:hypothetical protein
MTKRKKWKNKTSSNTYPTKKRMNSGALEGLTNPALLAAPVMS